MDADVFPPRASSFPCIIVLWQVGHGRNLPAVANDTKATKVWAGSGRLIMRPIGNMPQLALAGRYTHRRGPEVNHQSSICCVSFTPLAAAVDGACICGLWA
jgi:hypothetical protein